MSAVGPSSQVSMAHYADIPFTSNCIKCMEYSLCFDMHDAAHTMMISDITTNAWLIDFCHKAIKP